MIAAQSSKKTKSGLACVIAVLAGTLTGTLLLQALWSSPVALLIPNAPGTVREHLSFWTAAMASALTKSAQAATQWTAYKQWVSELPLLIQCFFLGRLLIAGAGGLIAAVAAAWAVLADDRTRPTRGRSLIDGRHAVALMRKDAKREVSGGTPGIHLHPGVQISSTRESRHFLVLGGSGSGKTQVIWQLLGEAIQRRDRVIVFDPKGDFYSKLPGEEPCLLAPWDERSWRWDLAADCPAFADARALAARLIPANDKDPMWANASREVLVAVIASLQAAKGNGWTFRDLREALNSPLKVLQEHAAKHNPEALRSLEDASKTTQSILINLSAFLSPIADMDRAWGDSVAPTFSMRRWVRGTKALPKVVVIQGSQRFEQATAFLAAGIFNVLAGLVASPELPDSTTRRIWLFLDEFPQLGRLEDVGALVRLGRSKGIRVVLGVQDIAELRQIYGSDRAEAWTSSLATSIYTRLEGGSTAQWVSKRIGEQEREEHSRSSTEGTSGRSATDQSSLRRSPTVLPVDLKTLLGPRADGVDVLVDGFDSGIYLVRYPHQKLSAKRKPFVPARWVSAPAQDAARAASSNSDALTTGLCASAFGAEPTTHEDAEPAPAPSRRRRWVQRPSSDKQ